MQLGVNGHARLAHLGQLRLEFFDSTHRAAHLLGAVPELLFAQLHRGLTLIALNLQPPALSLELG
eukprot:12255068-Alexandrium_andersonii.AAC.1